jgi:hypothetical protein
MNIFKSPLKSEFGKSKASDQLAGNKAGSTKKLCLT